MRTYATILFSVVFLFAFSFPFKTQAQHQDLSIAYFGDTLLIPQVESRYISLQRPVTEKTIKEFYNSLSHTQMDAVVGAIKDYKLKNQLDDWLFYQLVRRTAQQLSPKAADYEQYTVYKWFLLVKCGYNAQLAFANHKLLFYVQSNENIYDIPLFEKDGKQFVCLNNHDFPKIDFEQEQLFKVDITVPEATKAFSYKVTQIPDFKNNQVEIKQLAFEYHNVLNSYLVSLNPYMGAMFNNYPGVDFASYFNIPLSKETYGSLIPMLKKKVRKMKEKQGIDYLMNFTRHAFMYENDEENFGKEKRLSPEQTLMNDFSDCDDRVALFYYLVKEIYNLPMIVLQYPSHLTIAIALKKPVGSPVEYKGIKYSVCEPTPQRIELPIGQLMPELRSIAYQVAYEYLPYRN